MTDEERALFGEMARLKAEDAEAARVDAARNALRERQQREERYAAVNLPKIVSHWRTIMRAAKTEALRREVDILAQSQEREVDRLDSIIALLLKELEEAEEQYQMAARGHVVAVDRLVALHRTRMDILERNWMAELRVMIDEFADERDRLVQHHKREVQELRDIMAAMEEDVGAQRNRLTNQHASDRDELKRRHEDELVNISNDLRQDVLDLYQRFRVAMEQYNQHTNEKQRKFRQLKEADKNDALEINANNKHINQLKEQRDLLRAKIATNAEEFTARNRALAEEKDAILAHFHRLKKRMNVFRKDERRRLTDLTKYSNDAIKNVEDKLGVAERILTLSEICRKLETEEEQVLPFYRSTVDDTVVAEAEAAAAAAEAEAAAGADDGSEGAAAAAAGGGGGGERGRFALVDRVAENLSSLENFYKRYNKVLLDKLALEREEAALEDENENLKILLQRYLNGLRVNDEVLDNPANPLLVVASEAPAYALLH